jgi:hypothetical protein
MVERADSDMDLHGRERELASLEAIMADLANGPAVAIVGGEAGIGKSVFLQAAEAMARRRGIRCLVARPAETERSIAWAVLSNLLDRVEPRDLDRLAAPRRAAIDAMLLRTAAPGNVMCRCDAISHARNTLVRYGEEHDEHPRVG